MTTPDDEGTGASRPRITRPEPERTMPRRSWSTLLGPFGLDGAAGAATGEPTANGGAEPRASDNVARAVELGYRVIDEYIRQGQKAAQRLSNRSWTPETALRDSQDLTARMTRHASDLVGLWLDVFDTSNLTGALRATMQPPDTANGPADEAPQSSARAGDVSSPAPAGSATGRTRIAIDIASERPAEVAVDLRSEDMMRKLVVHSLRAVEPEKPRITEVSIEPATLQAPARLRIRVPADQPAGTYNALVIDEATSRPVGSVSLRVAS
jgi:hypothetical protein